MNMKSSNQLSKIYYFFLHIEGLILARVKLRYSYKSE